MRVLIAVDGSDPAMRACTLVGALLVPKRDTVRLLTILSYSLYPYSGIPDEPLADEAARERHADEEVRRITDAPRALLEDCGLAVDVAHRFGNVTEQILSNISEEDWDIVVLGHRGVQGMERLTGSVSEHVLHHSRVPVLLVP